MAEVTAEAGSPPKFQFCQLSAFTEAVPTQTRPLARVPVYKAGREQVAKQATWMLSHCRVGAKISIPAGSSVMGLSDTWTAGSRLYPKQQLSGSEWVTAPTSFQEESRNPCALGEEAEQGSAGGPVHGLWFRADLRWSPGWVSDWMGQG